MPNLSLYRNPIGAQRYAELTPTERASIAVALDQEYRGDGIHADSFNISDKITQSINRDRLERMALYINVYRRIIDTEANSYSQRGFQRIFTGATKAEQARLTQIYRELKADLAFIEFERQASYLGTVMVTIVNDPITNQLRFVKLTAATPNIKVKPNEFFPNEIEQIEYITNHNGSPVTNIWNPTHCIRQIFDKQKNETTQLPGSGEHQFTKAPFAILRYITDSCRFWGPLDFSAYSFFQTRSLLLSDAILRSQTSLFDMLVFSGYSAEEAIEAVKKMVSGKVLINPTAKQSPDGTTLQPDVKYISPSMLEPEKIWQLYINTYTHFLQSRGMTPRNFEVGSDPQSADAQRISDQYILSLQQSHKRYLQHFEQEIFALIKWRNNNFTSEQKISDKVSLVTDFQDVVSNSGEKLNYINNRINLNTMTPVDVIRLDNPDLSEKEALEVYNTKKKFNTENGVTADTTPEPVEDNEE